MARGVHPAALAVRGPRRDHGRDGVFEDELFLVIRLKYDAVFVEPLHTSREFDSAGQVDVDRRPLFPSGVEEGVLQVLARHCDTPGGLTAQITVFLGGSCRSPIPIGPQRSGPTGTFIMMPPKGCRLLVPNE